MARVLLPTVLGRARRENRFHGAGLVLPHDEKRFFRLSPLAPCFPAGAPRACHAPCDGPLGPPHPRGVGTLSKWTLVSSVLYPTTHVISARMTSVPASSPHQSAPEHSITKGSSDISVLCAFDLDAQEPVCPKCFPGKMLDVTPYGAPLGPGGQGNGWSRNGRWFPGRGALPFGAG